MARPIRTLLQRRPVRNAVRMLLGVQPLRPRARGGSMVTSRPDTGLPGASAAPPPPNADPEPLSPPAPVKPLAPAIEPTPDAMAVASDTDLDTGPTRLPGRMADADATEALRARSGLFANLPAATPRPKTTEVAPPLTYEQAASGLKWRDARGDVAPATPVAEPPAAIAAPSEPIEATPQPRVPATPASTPVQETAPASAPADPRLERASSLRQEADRLRTQLSQAMEKWYANPDPRTMPALQMGMFRADQMSDEADALEQRMYGEKIVERELGIKEREIPKQDTLSGNTEDFANTVRAQGMTAAVNAALLQSETPLTPEQAMLRRADLGQIAGGVQLAEMLQGGQAPQEGDTFVTELSEIVYSAYPGDRGARARMVASIVNAANSNAGRRLNSAQGKIMADILSRMVERSIMGRQ